MPSPPWTNPDQDEFLESKLSDFLAAQRDKTTTTFWKAIYRDFFDKWADPADEIPVITVPKKRKRKDRVSVPDQTHTQWVEMRKQQINHWFYNRRHGVNSRRQTASTSTGGTQSNTRMLSELNLYSKKYYDERVRDKAAEAWQAVLASTPDPPPRITVINKCLEQCWKEESEDIKKEIRDEYAKLKEEKTHPVAPVDLAVQTAEGYATAQAAMPPKVKAFMVEMARETGFACSFITGGPDPKRPGRMRVLAFHEGVDRFDQKFGTAYASFTPNVLEPYQKFLYNMHWKEELALGVVTQDDQEEPALKKLKADEDKTTQHSTVPVPGPSSVATSSPTQPASDPNAPGPSTVAPNAPGPLTVATSSPTQPASDPNAPGPSTVAPNVPGPLTVATSSPTQPASDPHAPGPSTVATSSLTQPASDPNAPATTTTGSASSAGPLTPSGPQQSPISETWATGPSAPDQSTGAAPVSPAQYIPQEELLAIANLKAPIPPVTLTQTTTPFSYDELGDIAGEMGQMEDFNDVNQWEIPQARSLYYNQGSFYPFSATAYWNGPQTNPFWPGTQLPHSLLPPVTTMAPGPLALQGGTVSTESPSSPPPPPLTQQGATVSTVSPSSAPPPPPLTQQGSIVPTVSPSSAPPPPLTQQGATVSTESPSSAPPPPLTQQGSDSPSSAPPLPPLTQQGSIVPTVSPSSAPLPPLTQQGSDSPSSAPPLPPLTQQGSMVPTDSPSSTLSSAPPILTEAAEMIPNKSPLTTLSLNTVTDPQRAGVEGSIEGKPSTAEERPSRNRKPPMRKEVQPVMWLDLAHTYLMKDLEDEKWKACVGLWLEFEKQTMSDLDTNSRRIPAKGRPALLSKWLATRNYAAIPKLDNEAAFGLEWVQWWNDTQPKWRKSLTPSTLPLSIASASVKDDISPIKKFGPTGLVTALIGLKWWAGTRGTNGIWESAVVDMISCFERFSVSPAEASSRKKRMPIA